MITNKIIGRTELGKEQIAESVVVDNMIESIKKYFKNLAIIRV